jgi:hypothetical protein
LGFVIVVIVVDCTVLGEELTAERETVDAERTDGVAEAEDELRVWWVVGVMVCDLDGWGECVWAVACLADEPLGGANSFRSPAKARGDEPERYEGGGEEDMSFVVTSVRRDWGWRGRGAGVRADEYEGE